MAQLNSVYQYLHPYSSNIVPVVPPVPPAPSIPYGPIVSPRSYIPPLHHNTSFISAHQNNGNGNINISQQEQPVYQAQRVTLQVVRKNNNRGSFNTAMDVPAGKYPTLQSLKVKIDYDLYYRYGDKGSKYQLNNDNQFTDIDWNDNRLTFNIQQKDSPVGQKRKDPNDTEADSSPKKKKAKKFDEMNEKREIAEKQLEALLPEELKNKMSRADMIQAAYLHSVNPELCTVEKIREHYGEKLKKKTIKRQIRYKCIST